ncbi:sensor histidine kinase [Alkalibacterium iburiense]|uniref:sensor histidine kinase n=1 Tax=Alkalibacterium iburiense TaxID=290589 RepID=UPI0031D01742
MTQLTANQQKSNLLLLNSQIEEQLANIEGQSVILGRQSNLNDVVRGNASYFQMNTLTNEISNIVVTSFLIDSFELYFDAPIPPPREDTPVKYGSLQNMDDKNIFNILGDDNVKWVGIREFAKFEDSRTVISHARKLRNFRGDVHALLIINLDPTHLTEWLTSFVNTSELVLLNEHDQVLANTSSSLLGNFYSVPFEVTDDTVPTFERVDNDLVVGSRLSFNDWKTLSVTPYSYLTSTSREIAINMIFVSIIMVLVALLFGLLFISKLTYPLKQLIDLMEEYKLNRTIQKIPNDYDNEFGKIFDVYRNLTARNEYLLKKVITHYRRQKVSELKALQANINPHFLYNTLDQLNWRAIENDDDEMSHMIELLGEMLRIGLSKGESVIPIEKEVEYVKKYLELQSIRLEDKLSYTIHVDDDIKNSFIPKLTLQPFVENSIVHGFSDSRHGRIEIAVNKTNSNDIVITLIDNGIGAENFQKESKTSTGGYGIKNVKERLKNYFENDVSICIENHSDSGVMVEIIIPNIKNIDKMSVIN